MRLDELHAEILEGVSGEEKESILRGMKILGIANPIGREALRESIRKAHPEYTEEQVEYFLEGRNPPAKVTGTLRESFKRTNPDWTDEQLDIAVQGR